MKRIILTVIAVVGFAVSPARAVCPSPALFDAILKVNVDKEGYVDYDSIRINKGGDLYQYISFLETADLKGCGEADRVAFWVNAYNAHMIRLILARVNIKQVSDDFALFGEKFKVANHNLTLNEIEHRILRSSAKNGGPIEGLSLPQFDPRLHFVLANGATGGPSLAARAYAGNSLESALQAAAANYVNSPKGLRIEGDTLYISSLFRWYAVDFEKIGGPAAFASALISPASRADAAAILEKLKTDFPERTQFRFDWTVNSVKNKPAAAPK